MENNNNKLITNIGLNYCDSEIISVTVMARKFLSSHLNRHKKKH